MKLLFTDLRAYFVYILVMCIPVMALATGEPSTYFNVFVPPNATTQQRNVCLIVTAIYDSTAFSIIDDGMDGDTDDSKTGMLMAGQSYVLYIKDNGINDDARYASGGVLKQDGDYFVITSNKLVYASQSTDSDWQHDWLPAVSKNGIGQKFIVYAPKTTSSNRDLNVFAYQDSTQITIRKVSTAPTLGTGFTNVNYYSSNIVVQRNLNRGQDLIYSGSEGRNVMLPGETYVIESNKPVTVQYGALYGNERDGGGYVPSSSGSSAGELFYFGVPYQAGTSGEQEIRVVSMDAGNVVTLERYNGGSWVAVKTWTANANTAVDWVGRSNGNVSYPAVFRLTCTSGKKVIVFEANWLETGSVGTSDIGTMCSSLDGTSSGNRFLVYMAPPGDEQNVLNPFTGAAFGQQLTHIYISAFKSTCVVNVKDAYTNGGTINRTYTVAPGRYVDCYLTLNEWKSIYNGTGTTSGPQRPYLFVTSDNPISVMNTNFNDNWMLYFGSSLEHGFGQNTTCSKDYGIPGDTLTVTSSLTFKNNHSNIDSATVVVHAGSGLSVVSSSLTDVTLNQHTPGNIVENDHQTCIYFQRKDTLHATHNYQVKTKVIPRIMYNNDSLVANNTVVNIDVAVTGKVNGVLEQSCSNTGVKIVSANTSHLMFSLGTFTPELTNSWTSSAVDVDNDGWEDLFVTDIDQNKPNIFYKNNGNGTFTKTQINKLTTDQAATACSSWADFNNDGKTDALVVNNTQKPNALYINNGNLSFSKVNNSPVTKNAGYYHSGAFADYDNDGWLDIFTSNFMPTRFNELYHNNGDGTFSQVTSGPVVAESFQSLGATWADYDNDGDQDLFVPNDNNVNNSLFTNNGNGTFTKALGLVVCNNQGNSTGSCWGDINNDGWLDLFVANSSNQNNFLYINDKMGGFNRITSGDVVNDGGHSHGCSFVDADNDMDLDLYVTNDVGGKFLYLNDGAGVFARKTDELLEANYGLSFGQSWFDADKDGDMDVFVVTHSGQKNFLFLNNGNGNRWTDIKLIGTVSNRDAIGARVRVKSGNVWQCREVNAQSGIGGQSSMRCHFGLGNNTTIDSVVVRWPSGIVQYITNLPVNACNTITEPGGGLVKGVVYYDANGNGLKDPQENGLANLRVSLDNSRFLVTGDKGLFSTRTVIGQHTLSVPAQGIWNGVTFPAFSLQSLSDTVIVYIPVTTTVTGCDLQVNMATTAMRKGFKNKVQISVQNLGSQIAINVPLTLTLSAGMTLKNTNQSFQKINNTYNWTLTSLYPGESFMLQLLDSVSVSKPLGSLVGFTASALSACDINPANNITIKSAQVVGAIDPNELTVSPKGEGYDGFLKPDTMITYTIRFQNHGSSEASMVSIKDQLPEGFDYSAVSNIVSSHPCEFNLSANGEVNVMFHDINLPDSASNFNGSQGFVVFSLPIRKGISEGTLLQNQADVQFDYESAIRTNTVLNTITLNSDREGLLLYPNPAVSTINVQLVSAQEQYQSDNVIKEVVISDSRGELIRRFNPSASRCTIELGSQVPGVYLLSATDALGHRFNRKIIVLPDNNGAH